MASLWRWPRLISNIHNHGNPCTFSKRAGLQRGLQYGLHGDIHDGFQDGIQDGSTVASMMATKMVSQGVGTEPYQQMHEHLNPCAAWRQHTGGCTLQPRCRTTLCTHRVRQHNLQPVLHACYSQQTISSNNNIVIYLIMRKTCVWSRDSLNTDIHVCIILPQPRTSFFHIMASM